MEHHITKNEAGKPVIETLDNKHVTITQFPMTGETIIEFKPNVDPKVIKLYKKLIKEGR